MQLTIKCEKLWNAYTDELVISLVWNTLQKEGESIIDGDWEAAGLPKNLCFIKIGWNYGHENSVPQSRSCRIILSYKLNYLTTFELEVRRCRKAAN